MKIAIIGTGNMGGAIIRGLAKGKLVTGEDLICANHTPEKLDLLKQEIPGLTITTNNIEAIEQANIIILAVKPKQIESVLFTINSCELQHGTSIVSVAAEVSIKAMQKRLYAKNDLAIFRVVPNTAIAVTESVNFIATKNANNEQTKFIMDLFSELGFTQLIDEKLISAGTALASCGIAFALRYIRAATEGGVELGFTAKEAQRIVAQTVKGAAELLLRTNSHAEVEIDKVTTGGGITIQGLNAMEKANFTGAVIAGLKTTKKEDQPLQPTTNKGVTL